MNQIKLYGLPFMIIILGLISYLNWLADQSEEKFLIDQEQKHQKLCSVLSQPPTDCSFKGN